MKDKLYRREVPFGKKGLYKRLQFFDKDLSSTEEMQLKYKIAKEGVQGYLSSMEPVSVTTYTWVYEW